MVVMTSSPEIYGNKGHQLNLLKKTNYDKAPYTVPEFVCIDSRDVTRVGSGKTISYSEDYYNSFIYSLEVKMKKLGKDIRVAVRSSGAVSMPGAMKTELDVALSDITDSIARIHESFNSKECVAYRNKTGILLDGTAAVVMEMAETDYSGVCFIRSVSDITIEGVKGYGDELVSGKASGVSLPKAVKAKVVQSALFILENFGPSDIEWVYKSRKKLQIVQRRDLKEFFNSGDLRVESPRSQIICKGESIGAATIRTGNVLKLASSEFTPDRYEDILNAAIIVTTDAGSHSHPALVAKTVTGAVVVNLSPDEFVKAPATGYLCLADGNTGTVYMFDPNQVWKNTIIQSYTKIERPADQVVIFPSFIKKAKLGFYDYCMANVLYACLNVKDQNKLMLLETACINYLYAAILREFRYVLHQAAIDKTHLYDILEDNYLNTLLKFPIDTRQWFNSIEEFTTRSQAAAVMAVCAKWFNIVKKKGSSVGGPAWAATAKVVSDALLSDYPPGLVLDRLVNLVHNNGSMWGKYDSFSRAGANLLDNKRAGIPIHFSKDCSDKFIVDPSNE